MELSKKVGYIKGLMAGLKIDDSTPEGQVLNAMSDLLEEMAEEIEINADIIDNITAYIDEVEDQCDCLDDIEATEFDPEEYLEQFGCDDCDCDDCCCEDELEELDSVSDELEEEAAEEQEVDGEPQEQETPVTEETAADFTGFDSDVLDEPSINEEPQIEYECECPICNFRFGISQGDLDRGSTNCPRCGGFLEFE